MAAENDIQRLEAQAELRGGADTASDAFETLRTGLGKAMKDIRAAVLDATKVATRS